MTVAENGEMFAEFGYLVGAVLSNVSFGPRADDIGVTACALAVGIGGYLIWGRWGSVNRRSRRGVVLDAAPCIRGDAEFCGAIRAALSVLAAKSPREYGWVCRYAAVIEQDTRNHVRPSEAGPRVIFIGRTTAVYSATWCAAVLVHEAYHVRLYSKDPFEWHVRQLIREGVIDEEEACKYVAIKTLERMEAPESEVRWMKESNVAASVDDGDAEASGRGFSRPDGVV